MPTYGRIEEFKFENNFEEYTERLEEYFTANEIDDNDKQRSIFLTVCGEKAYSLLRNLCAPDKPNSKTYAVLKKTLTDHLRPKPLIIAERYKFHQRKQESSEKVRDYLANLRKLADSCDFKGFLEEALRDRFVCGLYSKQIQRKLLSESDLTLQKAFEIAVGMEAAEKESNDFRTEVSSTTNKVTFKPSNTECYCCGKTGHRADSCFYRNSKCHKCGEIGHLSRKCKKPSRKTSDKERNPHKKNRNKFKAKPSKVHQVDKESESSSDNENSYEVFTIKTCRTSSNNEIKLQMKIENQDYEMELDTGAAVSLISESHYHKYFSHVPLQKTDVKLKTYTGDSITVVGELIVNVEYNQQVELLPLIVVKNGPSLFGRNWLSKITLDWRNIRSVSMPSSVKDKVNELMKLDVFKDELGTVKGITASLKLKDGAVPKFFKPRPVPYAMRDKIADEIKRLKKDGILEKIKFSEWGAPIVPVLKPDGKVRICGDYKVTINPCLEVPQYPLPKAEDLFSRLNGGQKFTKLDLSQAYQQVLLDENSRNMVTINTHLGLFRYTRLPFGAASSPAIFQELMDKVLEGIDGVGCILDDLIITGKNDEEYLRNVEIVLNRLSEYGLRLKKSKCSIMESEVEYFAFIVNKDGIQASPRKVEAMLKLPKPTNVKELQSWLGCVNYYRKFCPDMSTVLQPLNELLAKKSKWQWNEKCDKSFKQVCEMLSSKSVLAHYDPNEKVQLAVDASPYGLGCVISHVYDDGLERPIAYASRTLSSAERNYSQIEREALGIIFGVTRFHQYLYGRRFTLVTDNKPLSLLLGPKTGIPMLAASRIQRWAIQLSGYDYEVKCKSSSENANADGLSRLPLKEERCESQFNIFWEEVEKRNLQTLRDLPVNAKDIKREIEKDKTLLQVVHNTLYGWPKFAEVSADLKPYYRIKDEISMEEGCLLRGLRVIVPEKFREEVLKELHVNHPGIVRMKGLARMHVWWPTLDIDIETTVRNCTACQTTQAAPPATSHNPWIWPSKPWQRIHIDFCGPFMHEMFLIVIDAYSKWMDVVRMSSTTTEMTLNALRRIFATHGIPSEIVSDNGPQFTSEDFKTFLKRNGIKHVLSAPYHPASNGEAERAVRTFKEAMKTAKFEKGTLNDKLCRFLLSYRTTPHSSTKVSPAELLVGRRLRTRLDVLKPDMNDRMQKQRTSTKSNRRDREIEIGEPVLVRDYRDNNRWIKGVVVKKLGPVTYQIQVGDLLWKRHIDQIREHVPQDTDNNNQPKPDRTVDNDNYPDYELCLLPKPNPTGTTENSADNELSEIPSTANITPRRSARKCKPTERLIETM